MEDSLKDTTCNGMNPSSNIPSKMKMNREILSLTGPSIVAIMSFGMVDSINLIYMGHSGNASNVVGVGLGNSFMNVFAINVISGLNSTLGTLIS